jgi:antibiotic biosynthesis monooxygenase (ABM) superfamily enzyme
VSTASHFRLTILLNLEVIAKARLMSYAISELPFPLLMLVATLTIVESTQLKSFPKLDPLSPQWLEFHEVRDAESVFSVASRSLLSQDQCFWLVSDHQRL